MASKAAKGAGASAVVLIAAAVIGIFEPGANVNKPYLDTPSGTPVWTVCEGHTSRRRASLPR